VSPAAIWQTLGIEPTQDRKAIRSAYAAKLRAIDPDKDRDGFSALREARDIALRLAAQAESETEVTPEQEAVDGISVTLPAPALPLSAPVFTIAQGESAEFRLPPPDPAEDWQAPLIAPDYTAPGAADNAIDLILPHWTSPAQAPIREDVFDADRADHALHALLYPDPEADSQQEAMTQDEVNAGGALIDRLHADAAQGEIGLHDRIENWLSNVLAGAWPRSHPLLAYTVDRFGWAARAGQIDAPPAIDYINRRLASDRFAQAVQDKGHPLHGAWKQLSKPTRAGQSRALWWEGSKIDELIATIRRDYPELEQRLNWHRIALWEDHRARPIRWWTIAVGIIFALQLLFRIASSFYHPATPTNPVGLTLEQGADSVRPPIPTAPRIPGGLGDVDADLGAAITAAFGKEMTLETLKQRMPLVYQMFESNWRIGLDMDRTRTQYVETMEGLMRDRYAMLAYLAGGEALIALQRQRLKEEKLLKGEHWQACARLSRNGGLADAKLIPEDVRASQRPKIRALLLAMPANPVPSRMGGSFQIPGNIVERTMHQSGLSIDQVTAAFQGNGDDREKCLTHIGLLDATLDADKETRAAILPHI
jgi:hypothetical protein